MKSKGAIGRSVEKPAHSGIGWSAELVWRAFGVDAAVGEKIHIIGDCKRFPHIMADQNRCGPQRVVQTRIKLAMMPSEIGSNPAKGSSNRISSGSSAMARANATRRAIPPEISEGIK